MDAQLQQPARLYSRLTTCASLALAATGCVVTGGTAVAPASPTSGRVEGKCVSCAWWRVSGAVQVGACDAECDKRGWCGGGRRTDAFLTARELAQQNPATSNSGRLSSKSAIRLMNSRPAHGGTGQACILHPKALQQATTAVLGAAGHTHGWVACSQWTWDGESSAPKNAMRSTKTARSSAIRTLPKALSPKPLKQNKAARRAGADWPNDSCSSYRIAARGDNFWSSDGRTRRRGTRGDSNNPLIAWFEC